MSMKSRAQITHNDSCWSYGQHHYDCSVRYIQELQERIAELEDNLIRQFQDFERSEKNFGNH